MSQPTKAWILMVVFSSIANTATAADTGRWVWEPPDHPHGIVLMAPGMVNDLHVIIPHPPIINVCVPGPLATGMPYNNDYNLGTGMMSFGGPGTPVINGGPIGVTWTSKFASDTISEAQFTLNGVNVGEPIIEFEHQAFLDYQYDRPNATMSIFLINQSTQSLAFFDSRVGYGLDTTYLASESSIPFFSDEAFLTGNPAVMSNTSGTLLLGQQVLLAQFTLDDQNDINNTGFILASSTVRFNDGISFQVHTGGIGTVVPEPGSVALISIALAGLMAYCGLCHRRTKMQCWKKEEKEEEKGSGANGTS